MKKRFVAPMLREAASLAQLTQRNGTCISECDLSN
jgi:hypothetical protein